MARIEKFEDIEAWQKARELSKAIYAVTGDGAFARDFGLRDQIRRAAVSVMSNIAEGFGKRAYSSAEFKRYLKMSIGSCEEMRVWLRYCLDLEYVFEANWRQWRSEYREIIKMLHGLIRSWQ